MPPPCINLLIFNVIKSVSYTKRKSCVVNYKFIVALTTHMLYTVCVASETDRGDYMKIKLRVEILEELQRKNNWSDTELAKNMGISRSRLWRAKLPENHTEYCSPGEALIAGAMNAFPDKKFEDLFFLNSVCSQVHNEGKKLA